MLSGMVADGRRGYMLELLLFVSWWAGRETGERPDVYDCALEGGVRAGVPVGGEWAVAPVFSIGPVDVPAVAW